MELGYANRGTVYHVVSEALRAQTAEAVGELRSLEVERLDNLQLVLLPLSFLPRTHFLATVLLAAHGT